MNLGVDYIPPSTNVFLATPNDRDNLWKEIKPGLWYYSEMNWKAFHGPYSTFSEANTHFQVYLLGARSCQSCEE